MWFYCITLRVLSYHTWLEYLLNLLSQTIYISFQFDHLMQKLSWRNSKFHIYPNLTHKDCSSRKLRIRRQQASSEQADAQSRRQMSREMLPVHWHDYQLSRLSVHHLLRDSRRLSYQPEKLYAEALLEVLSKVIAEEINTTLKNECMACYDPAVQVHSCYLNNQREKVDRNFDNVQLTKWHSKKRKINFRWQSKKRIFI